MEDQEFDGSGGRQFGFNKISSGACCCAWGSGVEDGGANSCNWQYEDAGWVVGVAVATDELRLETGSTVAGGFGIGGGVRRGGGWCGAKDFGEFQKLGDG